MRVERIELTGFKSFAERTVFTFHPGITAIVGPNGCGKSNIVDAFKWVLGEQSAKSLRGDNMEDVIFSGSATKKTKGMAEVSLLLSDITRKPSNGNESVQDENGEDTCISVTRRLYRSGESEYLMNKVPCRLKDIKNMFLDTGLELKAYSILEQGRIGDIVNSKPQDRRFLIEEVAGVMKYKVRKSEALSKLESSKINLQRLQDIIAEVKRQINTIDRHARKAEKYKQLFEELKDIEMRMGKRDSMLLKAEISQLASEEENLKSKEAECSAGVHSLDALIEEKKRLSIEHEKKLNDLRTKLYAHDKEATEDEGKINVLKSDCENLKERMHALERQHERLESERENIASSLIEVNKSEQDMAQEVIKLETILSERSSSLSGIECDIKKNEQDLEGMRNHLFRKAEEISSIRNETNQIHLSIEALIKKAEKSEQDIDSLNQSLDSLLLAIRETIDEHQHVESELKDLKETKNRLNGRLCKERDELGLREEALYREREELAAMNSKMESLHEMDRSSKRSFDEAIRSLCRIADLIDTPADYETAIEAVLGDKLRADVVESEQDITRAMQIIGEQKEKRSGFIAVKQRRDLTHSEPGCGIDSNMRNFDGVLGTATEFITAKSGFESIVKALLDDVVLVNSLRSALVLRERMTLKNQHQLPYIVTLNGEVIEPSGLVFGGTDQGLLKIKRMVKEMTVAIKEKKGNIVKSEQSVTSLKDSIVSLENEIISVSGSIANQEKYSHGLVVKIENLEEEKVRLGKKHEYITLEINDDHRDRDNLQKVLSEKKSDCAQREDEKNHIEQQIRENQGTVSDRKETRERIRSELTEVKLNLASTTEKMASIKREIDNHIRALQELDRKKAETLHERQHVEQTFGEKKSEIVSKEHELQSKVVLIAEMQSQATQLHEILEAMNAELAAVEKQEKELVLHLETVRSDLSSVEMRKMEHSMKLEYLKEDLHKTYSFDIEAEDIRDSVLPEEEEKIVYLKEKIKAIGPVSLGTLDEYKELQGRFEFLSKQRDDLLESIDQLEGTIRKINRTTQKRLADAFEALNEKFKEVFTILFGKGRAELQLTEGSILDAGIEIIAQPPGKRLQNLMLLSGGEKALTALSLLFAGFMIKPTPLCILDEVDAPLDESNTNRFIQLLSELARNIQFITITHNRRTMESADFMYGITMEEPGASKVVSMHFAEVV